MKNLEQHHLHFISGGKSLNPVYYLSALLFLNIATGFYLAKNMRAATKEEEEYYFLTQCMTVVNQPVL